MSKSSSSRSAACLRRRKRPPLTVAIVAPRRRSVLFLPLLVFCCLLLPAAVGAATSEAVGPGIGGPVYSAVPVQCVSTADDRDDGLPVDRIPDGRAIRSVGRKPRRGSRRSQELQREREERRRRTIAEIDAIHAEYWREAAKHKNWPIGTAYARFSTRFQESIGDQVRKILEFALEDQIRVPRHLIFFDLAVRGVKNRRAGLDEVRGTLRSRKATVLLLFSTNRLFRKTYRTLEFVDTIHRELCARCIFVVTGIDTDDRTEWESRLHLHALMDQFVVRSGVAHIHAAHEGMLERRLVFGTLSYGYGGTPIPGELTKLGKPRREIIVDETTAEVVRRIFRWYVEDRLDVIEIIRRLKADPAIPLPPRALSGEWTRLAVRNVLKNSRYIGIWKYGVSESVFLPEADYVRQRPRVEPLKEVRIDALRIVEDALWYAAQERLATERGTRRGRPPIDGDRESRPKLLNGLLVCPTHDDQVLHVGGPHGNAMVCPQCRAMPAAERPLYTVLNRRLAAELLIAKLVELLAGDEALIEQSIAVCRSAAEGAQQPDPQEGARLRQELAQLERAISMTRRTIGESEEEQAAAEREIRELQGDAAGLRADLARLATAAERIPRVPTVAEVQALLSEATTRLTAAVGSDDDEVVAQARRVLELVTDGRIALEQQGERKPHRGWLRGRFHVRLLPYLVEQCGGEAMGDGIEVTIDFRRPSPRDAEAEQAWQLHEQGALHVEIAEQLQCCKAKVTKLLKQAAAQRGVPYEDGRSRRSNLERKHREPPLFERMAPEVGRLADEGWLLAEIGERLKLDRTTLTKAYNKYRKDQGLPPLDGRARRKLLDHKNRPRPDDKS